MFVSVEFVAVDVSCFVFLWSGRPIGVTRVPYLPYPIFLGRPRSSIVILLLLQGGAAPNLRCKGGVAECVLDVFFIS